MASDRITGLGTGVAYQYIAAAVFMLAGTLFFIFLTKNLSTEEVGIVSLLLAIVQLFSIAFSMGMRGAMEHYLSFYIGLGREGAVKGFLIKYGIFVLFLSFLAFALPFTFAGEISQFFYHSETYTGLIRYLSVDIAFAMAFNVMNGIATGLQHFRRGGQVFMVTAIAVYGFAVLFLLLTSSISFMILGWILGYAIGIAFYLFHFSSHFISTPQGEFKVTFKEVLGYSMPLLATSILFFGSTYVDRLIVAVFLDLSLLGIYNLALLIAQGLNFFINPLNNILLPKFSEMFSRQENSGIREGVRFTGNVLSVLYTPMALGVASLSPSVLMLFGNSNYLPGTIPLVIIVVTSAIFINQFVLVQALSGTRRTRAFLSATALSFLGNILFSFILIPAYGIMGAAIANSSAPVISAMVVIYVSRRAGILRFDMRTISRIWLSSGIMAGTVAILGYLMHFSLLSLIVCIPIGMILYLFLVKVLRAIRKEDAELLLSIFSTKSGMLRMIIGLIIAS